MSLPKRKVTLGKSFLDPHQGLNGDRYLVEVLELGDRVTAHGIHIPQVKSDRADEFDRGWFPALVLDVGNGHVLTTPDHAAVLGNMTPKETLDAIKGGDRDALESIQLPANAENITEVAVLVRPRATVPMFFKVGDVVAIDGSTGRKIEIEGKEFRIVNQVDVLRRLDGATIEE